MSDTLQNSGESPQVDLVVNTFERNYRAVLTPGFFRRIEDQSCFPFTSRVALINNVVDLADAEARAEALVKTGELRSYCLVDQMLPRALSVTGLRERDLGRLRHYSDCSLVAVTLPDAPWLLYWDPDIYLEQPLDWVTPAIERMEEDRRVMVANPLWEDPTLDRTTLGYDGDFALGRGFSDQIYLVRRAEFAAPIYRQRCIARYRYPVSAISYVFEARVDAWMRHHDRLRLTYLPARYRHPLHTTGSARERSRPLEGFRRLRNGIVLKALDASPWKPACCRLM
ncbi:MAG TPA: hypothetical protein VK655_09670 [Solirubrobacteraceae bacterium]|jgi:hypothetical protein|nr:hypothetical protein [Solirubrobacteraceae bacterium]